MGGQKGGANLEREGTIALQLGLSPSCFCPEVSGAHVVKTTSAGLREGECNTAGSETSSSDQQQELLLVPYERGHILTVLRQSTSFSNCLVALRHREMTSLIIHTCIILH